MRRTITITDLINPGTSFPRSWTSQWQSSWTPRSAAAGCWEASSTSTPERLSRSRKHAGHVSVTGFGTHPPSHDAPPARHGPRAEGKMLLASAKKEATHPAAATHTFRCPRRNSPLPVASVGTSPSPPGSSSSASALPGGGARPALWPGRGACERGSRWLATSHPTSAIKKLEDNKRQPHRGTDPGVSRRSNQARCLSCAGPGQVPGPDRPRRPSGPALLSTAAALVAQTALLRPRLATSSATPPALRCGIWDGVLNSSTGSSAASSSSSSLSSLRTPPACSPCTGSVLTPLHCCSSGRPTILRRRRSNDTGRDVAVVRRFC